MSHYPTRTRIRQKVVDLLMRRTDAKSSVYSNRVLPVWQKELPAILVYTRNETRELLVSAPKIYKCNMTLAIEILTEGDNTIDDTLDIIASQVEYAMNQDFTLGGLAHEVLFEGIDFTVQHNGENLVGSAVIQYTVPYELDANADACGLKDLNTINAEWNMYGAPTGQIDAEDTVTGLGE